MKIKLELKDLKKLRDKGKQIMEEVEKDILIWSAIVKEAEKQIAKLPQEQQTKPVGVG